MAKKLNVFLATPNYGGLPPHYVRAFYNLFCEPHPEYHFGWGINTTGSIAISRDILSYLMLNDKDKMDGILWIDSDMKWEPGHIMRLLSHRKPFVSAIYARKEVPARACLTGKKGEVPDKDGLLKVREVGFGLVWTAREIFEKMIKAYPEIEYRTEISGVKTRGWNFFWQGVKDARFYGEDYGFCRSAIEQGYDIFVDTKCACPHTGRIDYPVIESGKHSAELITDLDPLDYGPKDDRPDTAPEAEPAAINEVVC